MISQVLSSIEGVATYPLVSLLIFLPFFIIVTAVIVRMKKSDADAMSRIPFNDNETSE